MLVGHGVIQGEALAFRSLPKDQVITIDQLSASSDYNCKLHHISIACIPTFLFCKGMVSEYNTTCITPTFVGFQEKKTIKACRSTQG